MKPLAAGPAWSSPRAEPWLVPGFDPYASWTLCTGFSGHAALAGGKGMLPLLVKRCAGTAWSELQGLGIFSHTPDRDSRFASLWVPIAQVAALADIVGTRIEAFEMSLPIAAGPERERHLAPDWTGVEPQHSVAVIDKGGGAFLHANFRRAREGEDAARTRISAFWDQSHDGVTGDWQRGEFADYGRELRTEQIDRLLAMLARRSESELYGALGHFGSAPQPLPLTDHGSFVLDCAAGLPEGLGYQDCAKPRQADPASHAALVYVSIPDVQAQDSTCGGPAVYILDGLRYALANSHPGGRLIVNLSVGVQAGPHDGSSMLEQAMDELLEQSSHGRPEQRRDLNIVIAAGNGAGQQFNAAGRLAAGGSATLQWRNMPGDGTDSFLEFWWPTLPEGATGLSLRLRAPDGQESAPVRPGQASLLQQEGRLLAAILVQPRRGELAARGLIALAPALGPRGSGLVGRWRVTLDNDGGQPVDCLAWIQGDQPTNASGDPMQSRLEDVAEWEVLAGGTLNGIATGRHSLVIGASRLVDGRPSDYGSRGGAPSQPWQRDIDALASADASGGADGLCAAAVDSGTLVRMSGSSVAAPVAARQFFNWMCSRPANAAGHDAIKPLLRPARRQIGGKNLPAAYEAGTSSAMRLVLALTPDMPVAQWASGLYSSNNSAA